MGDFELYQLHRPATARSPERGRPLARRRTEPECTSPPSPAQPRTPAGKTGRVSTVGADPAVAWTHSDLHLMARGTKSSLVGGRYLTLPPCLDSSWFLFSRNAAKIVFVCRICFEVQYEQNFRARQIGTDITVDPVDTNRQGKDLLPRRGLRGRTCGWRGGRCGRRGSPGPAARRPPRGTRPAPRPGCTAGPRPPGTPPAAWRGRVKAEVQLQRSEPKSAVNSTELVPPACVLA